MLQSKMPYRSPEEIARMGWEAAKEAAAKVCDEQNAGLERLRREVTRLNECLRQKNLALDALHYVWCNGGCASGTHRWTEQTISEEVVLEAERNTRRLREWFDGQQARRSNAEVWREEADSAQQWAGMDGATAWHLIDRHADDWNEVGELMNAWLRANGGGPWKAQP